MDRKLNYSLLVIALIIVSVLLGIWFYQVGYANGNKDGYHSGYQNGIDSDNKTGWHDGYSDGYKKGAEYTFMDMSPFYLSGSSVSYSTNYFNSAWSTGWDKGIEEMVAECNGAYITKDVKLDELQRFLYLDDTNIIPFSDDFNCLGYAFTLKMNAAKQGIRCAVVILYYVDEFTGKRDIGHAINAFNPLNESIRYVEPQTNLLYPLDLKVGDSYMHEGWERNYAMEKESWMKNSLSGKLFSSQPPKNKYSDVIRRIVTIW